MATIGRITVAFGTDLDDLNRGIDEVIDRFDEINEAIDSLSEKLEGISDRRVTISVTANTTAAERAIQSAANIEDLSTEIEVTANASAAAAASEAVRDFGTAAEQAAESSARSRSSIASFVVQTAAAVTVARQAATSYMEFRGAFFAFTEAATGAGTATSVLRLTLRGLAGDTDALQAVFGGVKAGIDGFVAGLLSAERINSVLQGTLGATLRILGATDDVVIASTQTLANFITQQIAHAASHRLVQRSLAAVSTTYDAATTALAGFLTETAAGEAVAAGLSRALVGIARLDSAIRRTIGGVSEFLTSTQLMARVSVLTGDAFDAVAGAATRLFSGIRPLTGGLSDLAGWFDELVVSVGRSLPPMAQVTATFTSTLAIAGRLASFLGRVASGFELVYAASQREVGAREYAALTVNVTATTAAMGALSGSLTALATGASLTTGAIGGATASLGALVASITTVAPLAITAAAASGKFADQLERIGKQAGLVEKLSDRFGAPADEIQRLVLAAGNADVSIGQLAKSQQNLFASISKIKVGQINVDSVREAKLSFDRLGISLDTIQKSDPQQIFGLVAQEIGKITDPADRAAIAMDLFGKQGVNILPALKDFRELADDFKRLGGAINEVDLERFQGVDKSFDRLNAASERLGKTLALPFVESQRAINNFGAEARGGLIAALEPVASLFADLSRPIAAVIEVLGRVFNIIGRIVGVFTSLAAAITPVKTVATIFEAIGDGILAVLAPLESVITVIEEIAAAISKFFGTTPAALTAIAKGVGVLVGVLVGLATVTAGIAAGAAAAWAVYRVAMASATIQAAVAAVQFTATWLAALGPVGAVVVGIVGVGAALYGLYSLASPLADLFTDIGRALGLVGEERRSIDAATASTEELADAIARRRQEEGESRTASVDFNEDRTARAEFDARDSSTANFGVAPDLDEAASDYEQIRSRIQNARDSMGGLIIESARFGQAGADAAESAQKSFNDLQQQLVDGKITLDQFGAQSGKVTQTLRENLELLRDDSPQVAIKRNLELYKALNDAAKEAGKSVREISAGTIVEDKFFPTSEAIKANAKTYRDIYVDQLREIQEKTQRGEFASELKQRRDTARQDYQSGRIGIEEYQRINLELDSTNAQEQASIAAEDVRRNFERDLARLGRDVSFADNIRKELETAFLSPVEKFQKELQKIRDNKSLGEGERALAEQNLTRQAREGLIGKTDAERFSDRRRDLQQGAAQGLISPEELNLELKKNADALAQSLGIPVDPSSALDVALGRLQEAVEGGAISMDQFAAGAKEARAKFLESLGVSRRPEDADRERLQRLDQNAGRMSPDEYARGRRELEASIIGESASDRISSQRQRIEAGIQSGAVGQGRGEAALRRLDIEQTQAAGLELDPSQQLQAGIDRVQDAFGVAGKSLAEIQAELSPEKFAQYQRAIEKTQEAVQSAIVGESSSRRFAEQRRVINEGVASGAVDPARADAALRRIDAEQMQARGLDVGAGLQVQLGVDKIQEGFDVAGLTLEQIQSKLSPEEFEQYQKAIKDNRDAVRQSLGVEKSGADQIADSRKRLSDAVKDGVITEEEKNKAIKDQRDALLASLGIEKSPTEQFEAAVEEINRNASELSDAEFAEAIESAKDKLLSALGIEESPSEKFKDRMDDLNEAVQKGKISQEEFAKGAQAAKNSLLQSLGIPLDPAEELRQKMKDLQEAFDAGQINAKEFARGQEEAKKALPGGEPDSPVVRFQRDLETLRTALSQRTIDEQEFNQRRLNLQADLQEELAGQVDLMQPDRRMTQGADVRSREGVDTFFRLLQGQDNPSLKAQLETARNTRNLLQALQEPEAAPVVAQLPAR